MRFIFIQIFFLISLNAICQNGQILGRIETDDAFFINSEFSILLKQGDSIINKVYPNSNRYFGFKNITSGYYRIVITRILQREVTMDSIYVTNDSTINLILAYPGPCKFVYINEQKPKCLDGHSDHIIPIIYGYPTQKMMKKAKKGLIHLGGCIVTDCDPKYYCTIHKKEL